MQDTVWIYPTETIYGIGGDGRNETVIRRVQEIKGRDAQKPMLWLTDTWQRVNADIQDLNELHHALMALPLPLTILFRPTEQVPSLLTTSGYVGIRKTTHPVCLKLIRQLNAPLLSTSANFAGESASHLFAELNPELLKRVDKTIEDDRFSGGIPSTVVKIIDTEIEVIREGAVSLTELQLWLRR